MFKKSLAAVAVLGAFAANSMAADVTLYGKVDMGLQYSHAESTNFDGEKTEADDLQLNSGVGQASRIGLKATEDLGNGYKVSFVLENGFNVDDGNMKTSNKLFDREASLKVSSEWGTLMAGRFGAFSTAATATDILLSRVESFDGGHTGAEPVMIGRQDNALAYFTPKIAGFQAAAMYSFKSDNSEKTPVTYTIKDEKVVVGGGEAIGREGHDDANRYAGLAMTYDIGALQTAIGFEQIIRGVGHEMADQKLVTFGGNYDFDMFKLYAGAQYFEGAKEVYGYKCGEKDGIEGYGLHIGAKFDALAGHFDTGIYYADAEAQETQGRDGQYFGIAGRYIYSLSARTNIRTTLAYNESTWDKNAKKHDQESDKFTAKISLTHNF